MEIEKSLGRSYATIERIKMGKQPVRLDDRHFWNFEDSTRQKAIIVDLDGSLCLFGLENPYDRDYSKDTLNPILHSLMWGLFRTNYKILLVSGRFEKNREVTKNWLFDNDVMYNALFMRPDGDKRKDDELKEEIYLTKIKPFYNVYGAFDDRKRIKRMWSKNNVYVFDLNQFDLEY